MIYGNQRTVVRTTSRVVGAGILSCWVYAVAGCSADAADEAVGQVEQAFHVASRQSPYLETTAIGPRSALFDDATSEVSCPLGWKMSGCDCHSPWAACDGAYAADDVCYAFNKGGGGRGVYAVAQCIMLDSKINGTTLFSPRSGTSGQPTSSTTVGCNAGSTLTGCSCHSPWAACDGASVDGAGLCRADNKSGGQGVYAAAICLELGEASSSPVLGPLSGTADDAPSTVTCPDDHILTGCTCYSENASCDGAKIDGLDCVAFNRSRGTGVQAQAICTQMRGCHDHCGSEQPAPEGCYCDWACQEHGDCCNNYLSRCQPELIPD